MKLSYVLMAAVLLAGSATMYPTEIYADVAGSVQSSADRTATVTSDQEPDGLLTLQRAIDLALANNPEIAARSWDVSAAQSRRDQAFGARLPRLYGEGGYNRFLNQQRLVAAEKEGDPGLFGRDIFYGDLVLSLPLFTGGRLVNQVKATDLLGQAASHRLSRGREELIFNVSSVFYAMLAQRQVITSLEFSKNTLAEHVKRIDALVAAQKAARVDRMRTDVRLADVEQQLLREMNLLAIQQRALISLLGLENIWAGLSLQGELETREKILVPDLATALATAWKERGDYLAARSALDAQVRLLDVARSGHWPTLSLQGAYGGRMAAGSTTGAGDDFADVGRVGLVLNVPIFEGGQVDAGIREQHANLAATRQRLRLLELQVRLEVETALRNVESSDKRAAALRTAIDLARESLRIEQQKYNLGKGAIVDVLDAQSAVLATDTNYYRVLAERHTALAQLKLTTGKE